MGKDLIQQIFYLRRWRFT